MARLAIFHLFYPVAVLVLSYSVSALIIKPDFEDLLHVCQEGENHKKKPEPESGLFGQCLSWKKRTCCTSATSQVIHRIEGKSHNIDFDQCQHIKPLSSKCAKSFVQERCFYECSPVLGPWLFNFNRDSDNKSPLNIPLCASDCSKWFRSCQNDFVCADRWNNNITSSKMELTGCSSCRTFQDIFLTAEKFCERVWGHWWKSTPENDSCMRLWFDVSNNPNEAVALKKLQEIQGEWAKSYPMIQQQESQNLHEFLVKQGIVSNAQNSALSERYNFGGLRWAKSEASAFGTSCVCKALLVMRFGFLLWIPNIILR